LNDGKGNFTLMDERQSGVGLSGMVRDIAIIKGRTGISLLFLRNSDYPVLLKLKQQAGDKSKKIKLVHND
jgi:hypothetical protein